MPARNATCGLLTIQRQHDYRKPWRIDYTPFVNRVSLARQSFATDAYVRMRYERANHTSQLIADRRFTRVQVALETCLHEHIERWKSETKHWSSMARRIAHPSYLRIIGLAKSFTNHEVERALLRELQKKPSHWFAALTAITGDNPIQPDHNFDEAVAAWLIWGRKQGII